MCLGWRAAVVVGQTGIATKKYQRNTVARRIRFEAFACAGFPASATVLRRHFMIQQRTCRPGTARRLSGSHTASLRRGVSVRLPSTARTAGIVVAAPIPINVRAMARRRGSGMRLATRSPAPKARAARVATTNPNSEGRSTKFISNLRPAVRKDRAVRRTVHPYTVHT